MSRYTLHFTEVFSAEVYGTKMTYKASGEYASKSRMLHCANMMNESNNNAHIFKEFWYTDNETNEDFNLWSVGGALVEEAFL